MSKKIEIRKDFISWLKYLDKKKSKKIKVVKK